MISYEQIFTLLKEHLGEDAILETVPDTVPFCIKVRPADLLGVCAFLHTHTELYFDQLSSIAGIDNGPDSGSMEVVYQLYSIPFNIQLGLLVELERSSPSVPSLTSIWAAADWHEREAFDLLGIIFEKHPDLRRILLPSDWEGHPLKKDYQAQENYHGLPVDYNNARQSE